MPAAAVTPSGVRDGDPAALAALCAVRGPSVLAYCRHVAGDSDAGPAAADAFARFRALVVATADLTDLNPEALLINATRNAAARHAPRPPLDICAVVPLLLAARAAKTISDDDRATLEQHLQSCWSCRAPVARLEAAERAYRDPPDPLMDPAVVAAIIAAMAAAAPAGRARRRPQAANGSVPAPPPPAVERPTTELRAADVLDPDPVAAELTAAAAAERERPAGTGGRAASLLGTLGLRQGADLRLPPRVDAPDPESELVLEAVEAPAARAPAGSGRIARGRRGSPSRRAKPAAVPVLTPAGGRNGAGSRLARRRSGLRLPIILPVAVILLALLVALFVSGVFGGDDPASSPRVDVPADAPAQDAPADVVVVPGAGQADSEDVESSKARERARERRRREAAAARRAAAQRERAAAAPAAAPAPQPGAAPPPPPPPPPAADDGSRQVEAGRGATGAEQIPPAGDSSTVPELAPAPEPATSP